MKHFWRIAITVVVLVALGFTSYFLFFKPDSDLETFTKLSDTIDKRDSLGIDSKLYELYKYDGHGAREYKYHKVEIDNSGNDSDFLVTTTPGNITGYKIVTKNLTYESTDKKYYEFDTTNYVDIVNYRNLLFYNGIPSGNLSDEYKVIISSNDSEKVYTYAAIEESLDGIFDYYFAYAQVMDGVKNSDQKDMNKTIKSYNTALSDFDAQLKSVLNYQYSYTFDTVDEKNYSIVEKNIEESDKAYYIARESDEYNLNSNLSGKMELTSRYLELIKSYRNLLSKKCDVIEKLKDMVTKYVFDGEFIIETSTVKMDLTLMIINSAISGEYVANDSERMLLNATHFIDIYMGVGDFKNGSNADEVLEKYNRVVKNAKNDLKYVLSLSNAQLHKVASGDNQVKDIMSTLNQQYIVDIQAILKAYGFGI